MSKTVDFGFETVAPEEKTRRVGAVFSSVARRYDIMNDAMSGGMHRLWKDQFVTMVAPKPDEAILDMAGGTGDIAFRLAKRGAKVTVADINADMLAVGEQRAAKRKLDGLTWSVQNAEVLHFKDQSFDAYTIAFGIRNVSDRAAALAEAWRVLKFGGRFFCMEFGRTTLPGFGAVYDAYAMQLVPRIGKVIARDEASYRYLAESIAQFPPAANFKAMITAAGFTAVRDRPILGGLVTIYSGWKA
jgi:demethylmenaquinone methyltransferase / 2-methoxy-6-polyprenyl-1,4-benzoquinol methylase